MPTSGNEKPEPTSLDKSIVSGSTEDAGDAVKSDQAAAPVEKSRAARDLRIGFDLGGTKMLAGVFDSQFELLGKKRKGTKGHHGVKAGVARVCDVIREAIIDAEATSDHVTEIGIAVPGPIDLDAGVVLDTPNIGWHKVPLRKMLEDEFEVPVFLMNDVDAGVYGEYRFGAARKARCVIGLFPGTGIGGGCVRGGEIFRGGALSCFEVGHMCIQSDGPLCGCGRRGCLEAIAGRLPIAAAAASAAIRGHAPWLRENVGTDISDIKSGAIRNSITNGDKMVEKIVRSAARVLGRATGSLINVLNPDVILLGGGLVESLPKLYLEEVLAGAQEQAMSAFRDTFKVVVSELEDNAAVKGAAAWAERCVVEGRKS